MPIPTKVTFKGLSTSEALESRIIELTEKLGHVRDGIERCDVLVEVPHRHHRRGREFHVRIQLSIAGAPADVIVSHDPGDAEAHSDPYLAVRDAFVAARRQLVES